MMDLWLTLFFTRGVGLETWGQVGLLEREVALYKALRTQLPGIALVTYGGRGDRDWSVGLENFRLITNHWGLPESWYVRFVTWFYPFLQPAGGIVKSNQVRGAEVALHASRRSGSDFIARCGYLFSLNTEREHGVSSMKAKAARALEAKVFPQAERVVVATQAMRAEVINRYSVKPEIVRVIPNYVLTDCFVPRGQEDSARKRVCYIGRLSQEKNLSALLDAMKGLDLELLIVGDGELRAGLQRKAKDEDIPAKFLGSLPHFELPALLQSCWLYVQPSFYEGHPKTILEAMACGLPVIGSNVSGIREIIQHGENGYLCGTSARAIRQAIQELLGDKKLRERLGKNAREYIVENFALDKVVKLELSLLEEFI